MTTYGFKVKMAFSQAVMQFCENNDYDYHIWNVDDFVAGQPDHVELEFTRERQRDNAFDFMKKLARL